MRIVTGLKKQPLSKAQLAEAIGHKSVSGELKKQLTALQDLGLIEKTLPDKPNSRLQKYRLTTKGLQHLKDLP